MQMPPQPPKQQYIPPYVPQPKYSPTHQSVPHATATGHGYNTVGAQYQSQTPGAAVGPHSSVNYQLQFNPNQEQFEQNQQQIPHRRQEQMGKMHLSRSDSSFEKAKWQGGQDGHASTPIPPQYKRFHSDGSYYSEGQGARGLQRMPPMTINYQDQERRDIPMAGAYAGPHGYASPKMGCYGSPEYLGAQDISAHGVSPSESLPLKMEGLSHLSIRERESDSSDEGEEEGPGIVTREVKEVAAEVIEETRADREIKTDIHKPFDPNLKCPSCRKNFRIGEIQKFKRHAKKCDRSNNN